MLLCWARCRPYWTGETTKVIAEGEIAAANAVSDDGYVVAGTGRFNSCCSTDVYAEAFRWSQDQGRINIGHGDILQGDISTQGVGISGDGNVVVGFEGLGRVRAFIWTLAVGKMGSEAFGWTSSEGMVGLGDLPGGLIRSSANAVSADGSVVVGGSDSASGGEAFIWDDVRGMRSLSSILSSGGIDLTGWTLRVAADVSADGRTIAGTGINPGGNTEAWIARIPEPSGLMLMVLLVPVLLHWLRAQRIGQRS